ncbi:hypothetical protein LAZ67_3004276 [Cordylochernes scorpioides]|uniref:Uncharacterized protein n=1 Tax=Cordylochernes scorpioides TaxID=51811 RepID=A0ABY6KA91_9ARAC|nr:hypothetical protein LAZ67_3004276 [Cordylochernes scorpioides]
MAEFGRSNSFSRCIIKYQILDRIAFEIVFQEPSPYGYKYAVEDGFGNTQERAEEGDGAGAVKGSYSVQDANGVYRVVEYLADDLGFRALVKTNEPGTANQNPADVLVVAEDVPPHVADYTAHHQAHLQAHHAHHHVPVPHLHHAHHHHAHHDHPPFPAPPPKFAAAASYAPKPYVKPAPAKYRPPVYVQPPKPDAIHLLEAPQMNRPQHLYPIQELLNGFHASKNVGKRIISFKDLSSETGLSVGLCHQIVTKDLDMIRTSSKFVPRILTEEQKEVRIDVCKNMVEMTRIDPEWMQKIITGDETWVYQYDPETKRQSSQWIERGKPKPKKARLTKSKVKTLLVTFF